MTLGLLVAGFVGALQTDQTHQARRVALLQPQSCIGGTMSLLFALMVVIVPRQRPRAEHSLGLNRLTPHPSLARAGLIALVHPIGRLLEHPTQQSAALTKQRRAQHELQFTRVELFRGKQLDQARDFLVLGDEDRWGGFFFIEL